MNKGEMIELLKTDLDAWNAWRKENPQAEVDLTQADLGDAELCGADLRDADLYGANLGKANLRKANLRRANLGNADLCGANLIQANLSRAYLSAADLSEADLSGADLREADLLSAILFSANLTMADLRKTEFQGSRLGRTLFTNCDVSEAKNLDKAEFDFPCSIGIDTIYRSQGKLPREFLEDAGVPVEFITYVDSLAGTPIQYFSLFISYSAKDQEFADRLHSDLRREKVRCWLATEDLKIGDKFRSTIDEAIRLHDKLVIVLSEDSIESDWVEEEVESAMEREKREKKTVLFPVKLDDFVMDTEEAWAATIRRTRHIGDFTGWKDHYSYKKAFDRVLRDLKADETPVE